MHITKQREKKLGIFGLGKTGIATYNALIACAINNIICYDDNPTSRAAFLSIYPSAMLIPLTDYAWCSLDNIILSPGIALDLPNRHPVVQLAMTHDIPITSDLELLHEEFPSDIFIGITGTNGKSTTTALTTHVLQSCNKSFIAGGNIGEACLGLPAPIENGGYVLELSSFQIDLLNKFHLNIAVLLNITTDHIDRYGDFTNYMQAKAKITRFLAAGNTLVIAIDNSHTKQIYNELSSQQPQFNIIPVSVHTALGNGLYIKQTPTVNYIVDNYFTPNTTAILPRNRYLAGQHNLENIVATIAVAKLMTCDQAKILTAINNFTGLAHRMQFITAHNKINFYNDSKATNADSAAKSLSSLDNILWLAGGIAKEHGIESLTYLAPNIKKAYLFGQAAADFAKTLDGIIDYQIFADLEDAFLQATKDAKYYQNTNQNQHINILLAPACASFDQFKNFEARGNKFIELVQKYINLNNNIDL